MIDIFLSYARDDRKFAEPLAKALEDIGWSVWWDRRLEAGEVWDEVIASNIGAAKIVLVLWSPTSTKSRWVKNEARFADEKGKLVPVLVRSTPIPLEFSHRQTEDLTAWRGDAHDRAFLKLTDSLARRLGPMPSGSAGPEKRGLVWNYRLWLVSAALLALGGVGSSFFLLSANHQPDNGSGIWEAPQAESKAHQHATVSETEGKGYSTKPGKDESGTDQRIVFSESKSVSENTNELKDEPGTDQRMIIAVPGDKTIAQWTPGCLYEVRAEKQADGAWRACFGFDPNECFIAAGIKRGTQILKSGTPVFVTLSAARDRWAAGTLSRISDGRYYVQLRTGLECAKGGKPGLWAAADGVVAPREGD